MGCTKVAIIGAGFVGSTAAYSLSIDGVASEIVLIDINKEKAHGEALDLSHGNLFTPYTNINFGDSYELVKDSDVIVVTAGVSQLPGDNRMNLLEKNVDIMKGVISGIKKHNPNAVILIVSNPVDIITYQFIKAGFTKVLGSGTTLDSARFRQYLGMHYNVNPKSIHAMVLGEHGDSSFPLWSKANIAGVNLKDYEGYDQEKLDAIYTQTKNAAYEIVNRKGSTYYAIGITITKIVKAIVKNLKDVLPVSCMLENYYDQNDVCLSVPCIVGKNGIEKKIWIALNEKEEQDLKNSVHVIRENMKRVQF